VQKNRFLTLLLAGALVVAVATGGALFTTGAAMLTGGVSNAAPPPSIRQVTPTTTTLTTNPTSTAPQGTEVTLTAKINPTAAAGKVQFKDGPKDLGTPVPVTGGTALGKTKNLTVGSHQLTAAFIPTNSAVYGPSTSQPVTFVVTASAAASATMTSTTLTTSPASPVPHGTEVTLTAAITPVEAAGTVQFRDGTDPIGDPVTVSNGKASRSTSTLAVKSHQLTAVFTPTDSATYSPSTSTVVSFMVTDSSGVTHTSTTLTTSPASPVAKGNPVTLTATIAPVEAAGTVQFKADGTDPIGDPMTVSNGKASVSTSTLAVGSHQLTAVFTSTNAAYGPSTSPAVTFVITAPVAAATTTTTLMVVPDFPIPQGVPVLLKASVVPDGAAGKVQFQDGNSALGTPVPVVGGSAILITSTLPQGAHSLTAVFIPTNPATYGPSTSTAVPLTVTGGVGSALLERIILRVQEIIQDILDGDGCTSDCHLIQLGK
jgi:Bacterial Ig-like domain (group 3)